MDGLQTLVSLVVDVEGGVKADGSVDVTLGPGQGGDIDWGLEHNVRKLAGRGVVTNHRGRRGDVAVQIVEHF